ncbi:MAG TPA: GNAT family N-acetyltransferase [Telluria sp.]|nr:GNAT family N-acetyltransferase [Telluria sp.]
MKKICETERLTVRTMTIDDAPFFHALVTDPCYLRIIGDSGVRTLEQARASLTERVLVPQAELGYSRYLVQLHDGTAIGSCGLVRRPTLDGPDLGYAYLPAYWGRGYAVEAARAIVEHAQRDIGMTRLLGITSPDNTASIGVLTKLGFRFERFTYLDAADTGTNVYSRDLT